MRNWLVLVCSLAAVTVPHRASAQTRTLPAPVRVAADAPTVTQVFGDGSSVTIEQIEVGLFLHSSDMGTTPLKTTGLLPLPFPANYEGETTPLVAVEVSNGWIPSDGKDYRVAIRYHGKFQGKTETITEGTITKTPPLPAVTSNDGAVWRSEGGVITRNGVATQGRGGVVLFNGADIFVGETSDGWWWRYTGQPEWTQHSTEEPKVRVVNKTPDPVPVVAAWAWNTERIRYDGSTQSGTYTMVAVTNNGPVILRGAPPAPTDGWVIR